ncbi:MAG: hypothetical protein FJ271_27365 [Planctomycetes bacterium]|nr:hypothetical protein [Planctomycetota bacterium]
MANTPPNRRWLWYFVAVVVLSLAAVVTLIVFNRGQQLTRAQFDAARKLWEKKGLQSYQLTYTQRKKGDAKAETYVVRARSGTVVSVSLDGRPLEKRLFPLYGINALFAYMLDFLEQDAKPGQPRTFTRARFDPETGALRDYVRNVMGGGPRVEIRVDSLVPLED